VVGVDPQLQLGSGETRGHRAAPGARQAASPGQCLAGAELQLGIYAYHDITPMTRALREEPYMFGGRCSAGAGS